MDLSINKKKEEIQNQEEEYFDPFSDYKFYEQNFEEEIGVSDEVISPVPEQSIEKEEVHAIENDAGSIPAPLPKEEITALSPELSKPVVQQNIANLNNKLRFGKPEHIKEQVQGDVTPEMQAAATESSSVFQKMAGITTPQEKKHPFGRNSVGAGKPAVRQVEPSNEAPEQATESTNPQKGAITPEMQREALASSIAFSEAHKKQQEAQPPKKEQEQPDFVVESNIANWSTIARTDERINPNAMHKHMAEQENAIHEEMKHGQASVEYFDNKKPAQLNNYYEHSQSAALSHLATKSGNQLRESAKGKSNEKELNDVAFGDSKKFMEDKHKSEMEFNEKFNPEAVAMVEKKQAFERIDFNLRDKANNNRLGMDTISNTEASVQDKKAVKLNPIGADEKLAWLNAYKEFDKERRIYNGENITENKESRIAQKLESGFEKNYYKMMEKSTDKDYTFTKKEVKPAFEHNKGIKTSVSDLEKDRTQNSFRDFKSNQLGGTWKHELKDKSINSYTTVRPNDPFQEKKPSNQVNLNNGRQPAKFSDYSPELQAIILRADAKMQQEYGTKPLNVQMGEESVAFHSGKPKSMKQIWAETSQKYKSSQDQEKTQGKGDSAEMQAIKSLQPKSELTDDKKQVLGNINNIRENQTPNIVDDRKKRAVQQETGIGL